MTTDNRTNEPTPEQVEAAADAAGRVLYPHWDEWEEHEDMAKAHGELMREAARAALVAAQGAAPQAESEYVYCPIHGDLLAARRSFVCEHAKKGHEYGAPVLPSSTVDEDRAEAVREVARYIDRIAPNGLVSKKMILADMELAADRLGRGIHANGNNRAGRVLAGKEKNDE